MSAFDNISNREISELIDEWVHDERNRQILKDRYINGLLFNDLAEKYGLSVRHTQTIVYKAQKQLFKHIK